MKLTILGSGSAYIKKGRHAPSHLVEGCGKILLFVKLKHAGDRKKAIRENYEGPIVIAKDLQVIYF